MSSFLHAIQVAAREHSTRAGENELVHLDEAIDQGPQEEMVLDPRQHGVEIGRKSGKSLGTHF